MSAVQSTTGTSTTSGTTTGKSTDLSNVDVNQFLTLIITELQNQDPLNPTSNADFINQINTIRQIGSTNQLTDSLTSVSIGQNLSTASSLIGKTVDALDVDGNAVSGVVASASVQVDANDSTKRTVQVSVGGKNVDLKNIRQILPTA